MARMSVSVPDELTERLEPFKDQLNVSQVCREALERRLDALERAAVLQGEELDLESLGRRLREDRELAEGRFERLGRENAANWINSAPYLELRGVGENHHNVIMESFKLPRAAFSTMKKHMDTAKASCEGAPAVVYKTAWLDYVRAVWAQVVEEIDRPIEETEQGGHEEPVEASA